MRVQTLDEFKPIFWFEYAHRMLGRGLGLLFVVPAVYFGARGYIKRPLVPRLALLFTMGGTQGLIGWWMVKSGLEAPTSIEGGGYGGYDIPRVSPYRLATHLTSAFVIYAGIIWTGLTVLREVPRLAAPDLTEKQLVAAMRIRRFVMPLGALVAVTAVSGAFVAGMQAGHHFNTFPLMDGRLIPDGYAAELLPIWRNFFEHIPTVQFDHRYDCRMSPHKHRRACADAAVALSRLLATLTASSTLLLWTYAQQQKALPRFVKLRINALAVMTGIQFSLGIATLVHAVPVSLGSAHQAGALTLFTLALWTLHALRRPAFLRQALHTSTGSTRMISRAACPT